VWEFTKDVNAGGGNDYYEEGVVRPARGRAAVRLAALGGVPIVVIVAGIVLGSVRALVGRPTSQGDWAIIYEVWLPRTITATFCGAALGVAGLLRARHRVTHRFPDQVTTPGGLGCQKPGWAVLMS
jgi:ABC-type cobalamin transport system permease subunit